MAEFVVPALPAEEQSLAQRFAVLPDDKRREFLDTLDVESAHDLLYDWDFWARPRQKEPPGDWRIWLVLSGRGFGKTRMGAEWVRRRIERGVSKRISVAGATAADTRDICVEGPSGILGVFPPDAGARYSPTKRKITFDKYDAEIFTFSADEPERFRGHQHDAVWVDELAAWRYIDEAWTQLMLGLRLGRKPQVIITTTPKPLPLIRRIAKTEDGSVVMTRGSTYHNLDNLAEAFTSEIVTQYEGTRIGRQEIYADILEDAPGALWNRDMLQACRVWEEPDEFRKIVVAVDPAVSYGAEGGDETGIVVCGVGTDDHGYVLEDLSGRMKPEEWSAKVIRAYYRHQADAVVAEVNQGGDMVVSMMRGIDPDIKVEDVRASKSKLTRAEPVSTLYERQVVHHVGIYEQLEDQLCTWEAGDRESPDRLDALVWGITYLMLEGRRALRIPRITSDSDLARPSQWRRTGTEVVGRG